MFEYKIGDYAIVTKQPEHWDGSGEDSDDAKALVGHVGVVVEVDHDWRQLGLYRIYGDAAMALVRFPGLGLEGEGGFTQRNIELTALARVSRPKKPLPRFEG